MELASDIMEKLVLVHKLTEIDSDPERPPPKLPYLVDIVGCFWFALSVVADAGYFF